MKERIKQIRSDAGLTQKQFAERLRVNRLLISQWETGAANPGKMRLYQIADLFGVNLDWLNTGVGNVYKTEDHALLQEPDAEKNKGELFKRILSVMTDEEIKTLEDEIKNRSRDR